MSDKNKCANLQVNNEFANTKNSLIDLFEMQESLQKKYGYDFVEMRKSMKSLKDFLDFIYHADQDEWREFYEALGGVNSFGTAIWKKHKLKHNEALNRSFDDLTDEEKKELKFEVVDRLFFFLNVCLAIDLKPEELFNMYCAKYRENLDRTRRNY